MRSFRFFTCIFLVTFAVAQTLAEVIKPDPKTNKPNSKTESPPPGDTNAPDTLHDTLDITQPPRPDESRESYFYPYQSSLSAYGGPYFYQPDNGQLLSYGIFGMSYLWHNSTARHLESGFDALTLSQGSFWTSYRVNINSSERLRPFWSLGVGITLYSERGLATFLELRNCFIRGAFGFEHTLTTKLSLRLEIFLAPNVMGRGGFGATSGISWGF